MKLLTRRGLLIEEQGQTYMADNDGDSTEARALRPRRLPSAKRSACITRPVRLSGAKLLKRVLATT